MVIKNSVDEKTKNITTFYESSNILMSYLEVDEMNMYLIFRNGLKYKYTNFLMDDYVKLLTSSSTGKTFNEMKEKYKDRTTKIGKEENIQQLLMEYENIKKGE